MAKHKIEGIPFDAKVKIEIPGSFYMRLQQLTIHYSQSKPYDELKEAMQRLATKEEPKNEFEYHLATLTILMFEVETAAKAQALTKLEEIDIPEEAAT